MKKLQGKKWWKFTSDWFRMYPWLVLCTTRLEAFCSHCRYSSERGLLTEQRGRELLYSIWFDNWKKAHETFSHHQQSVTHREAILKNELMQQPSIEAQLSGSVQSEQERNRRMLMKQLSSLRYLLRQGLALRGHDENEGNLVQLLKLHSEDCDGLKAWLEGKKYLSHEIVNEMIRLMSNQVLREILYEIREASFFSLIADESSDISHCEQMCIRLMTIFWSMKPLWSLSKSLRQFLQPYLFASRTV